jgi:hypothetical protein
MMLSDIVTTEEFLKSSVIVRLPHRSVVQYVVVPEVLSTVAFVVPNPG